MRDEVVDFITRWSARTEISKRHLLFLIELLPGKYYDWLDRYGRGNQHNGKIPKKHWILESERQAIIKYSQAHPEEGYRRLTYMMLDENVAAVGPSSVYRVLKAVNLLNPWSNKVSKKGTGFKQPGSPHRHWHIDISYINIGGTFYYLCSILDGYSRYIVHWELRESMKEVEIEIIVLRAKEKFPDATPRMISDNGPQFIANDFKVFIRLMGMTHVRTSPYYPQSNGKLERWHGSLKSECVRKKHLTSREQAEALIKEYVDYYNNQRLHSAIGYIAPIHKLEGRADRIVQERRGKLARAKKRRRTKIKEENFSEAA